MAGEGDAVLRKALDRALRYLALRPRSEAEVRLHLLKRFPEDAVASALVRLREQGLLDDLAYARTWVQSRLAHKPKSAALLAREMAGRGVPREAIQEALAGADDETAAAQVARQYLRRLSTSDRRESYRKGWDHLRRRGFSASVIRHTLSRLAEEAELEGDTNDSL
jgi:regulatory protein